MDKVKFEYSFKNELFRKALLHFPRRFANQSQKAEALELSQSTISRLESGERSPNIQELLTFCSRAGYSPCDFFESIIL